MPKRAARTPMKPVTVADVAKRPFAELEDVDELALPLAELLGVVPDPAGLETSPAHVNVPLMAALEPERALKVLQSLVISPEL